MTATTCRVSLPHADWRAIHALCVRSKSVLLSKAAESISATCHESGDAVVGIERDCDKWALFIQAAMKHARGNEFGILGRMTAQVSSATFRGEAT